MVLFDLSRFTSFQPVDLDSLDPGDPIWSLSAAARKDALTKEKNRRTPEWAGRWAGYLFQTGAYTEAHEIARKVLDPANGPCDDLTLMTMRSIRCRCEFAMGRGKAAKPGLDEFTTLYEGSPDLFTQAMVPYLRGRYLTAGATGEDQAFVRAQPLLKTAARRFELCGKTNLAILARVSLASAMATMGGYIGAIKEVEKAMALAQDQQSYLTAGRILVIGAGAAADQGYRNGVAEALERGIRWCQFTGDFWGEIQGRYFLAQLKSYRLMPGNSEGSEIPEKLFLDAIEEAEQRGAVGLAAHATASLAWMYEKCGDLERKQRLLDRENERVGGRRPHFEGMFKNAGEVVRTVEQRVFARIQDGIATYPDVFMIFNPRKDAEHRCIDYIAEYRNERGQKIVGLSVSEMFLYSEVKENPYLKDLAEAFFEATDRHVSYQDLISVSEEGGEYWYTRRVIPSGNGAILIIRDVTAQQRLQAAALSAARDEALEVSLARALDRAKSLSQTPLDASQQSRVAEITKLLQEALDRLPG